MDLAGVRGMPRVPLRAPLGVYNTIHEHELTVPVSESQPAHI